MELDQLGANTLPYRAPAREPPVIASVVAVLPRQ
jgi:hypothetical protein